MVSVSVKMHPEAIAEAQRRLAAAGGRVKAHKASIGIHEEQGERPKRDYRGADGVELLAEAMAKHELGAGVTERSFLRSWFDEHRSRLSRGMAEAMRAESKGDKNAVREWVSATHAEWKKWIATGPFASLSERTVADKRRAGLPEPETPLIATRQFIDSWRAKLDGVAL